MPKRKDIQLTSPYAGTDDGLRSAPQRLEPKTQLPEPQWDDDEAFGS